MDNGSKNARVSLEVMQMTRTLCYELVELDARGKAECNNKEIVISQLVDALGKLLANWLSGGSGAVR